MLWAAALKFLVRNRKVIVYVISALVVIGALWWAISQVLDSYYKKGKAAADAVWVAKYNQEVALKNKRILELEVLTQEKTRRLSEAKDTAQKLVDTAYAGWQAEKAKGKPSSRVSVAVKCPSPTPETPTAATGEGVILQLDTRDIVLPDGYVDTWNSISNSAKGKP